MSQSTVKKIPNNYFDGMPVTGFHKIVFFIIMMAYFCEQMDNWNFGFIAPALMHTWGLQMSDIGVVTLWYFIGMTAGGFFGGVISDFIGRRKTFLIGIGGLIIFLLWDIQPIRSTLKKMPAWNFVGRKMKKNLA